MKIAIKNEQSRIFSRMNNHVMDVIEAAVSKWSSNMYYPGAGVGGRYYTGAGTGYYIQCGRGE